jgi:hypothetical protein
MVTKEKLVDIRAIERPDRARFRCRDQRQPNLLGISHGGLTIFHVSIDKLSNQFSHGQTLPLSKPLDLPEQGFGKL